MMGFKAKTKEMNEDAGQAGSNFVLNRYQL